MDTVERIRTEQQARYAIADKISDLKYPEIKKAVSDFINATPEQLATINKIMKARGYKNVK